MSAFEDRLRRLILEHGPISVARYMALALAHPTAGYYPRRDPFGAGGDFVTAPEISQLFGELIGLALVQHWLDLGRPGRVVAGRARPGTRHADGRRAARRAGGARVRRRARASISSRPARSCASGRRRRLHGLPVFWHDELAGLPDGSSAPAGRQRVPGRPAGAPVPAPVRPLARAAGGRRRARRLPLRGRPRATPFPRGGRAVSATGARRHAARARTRPRGLGRGHRRGGWPPQGGMALLIDYGSGRCP